MALYAIGDLHLSLGPADKPMDVFGGRWEGYVDKLRENLRVIGPEDTTVLLGDLSWAMSLEDAAEDFAFMNAILAQNLPQMDEIYAIGKTINTAHVEYQTNDRIGHNYKTGEDNVEIKGRHAFARVRGLRPVQKFHGARRDL